MKRALLVLSFAFWVAYFGYFCCCLFRDSPCRLGSGWCVSVLMCLRLCDIISCNFIAKRLQLSAKMFHQCSSTNIPRLTSLHWWLFGSQVWQPKYWWFMSVVSWQMNRQEIMPNTSKTRLYSICLPTSFHKWFHSVLFIKLAINVSANSPLFPLWKLPKSHQGIPIKYSLFTDFCWHI